MALAITAEVKKLFVRNGVKTEDWGAVTIADALLDRGRVFRCIECHARVKPFKEGSGEAHFEHFQAFEGCSLSDTFGGTKRRNLGAIS